MALTSIGDQKTPGRPIEITFAPETGLPSANQELLLIGRMGPSGGPSGGGSASGNATGYTVIEMTNVSDLAAASGEAITKFGDSSELMKMVVSAVRANSGGSTFPAIKCMPIPQGVSDFGPTDEALTNSQKTKAEFIVSPFDASNATLRDKLRDHCLLVSGAQRTDNNQFGSIGVTANQSISDPGTLPSPDSQYLCLLWFRNAVSPSTYLLGEMASSAAAVMAGNISPFNPIDNKVMVGVPAPTSPNDNITVGAGLESESALSAGWTPFRVRPTGEVSLVRTVTSRVTIDGVTAATAYYDIQDFQVLYFWRKTLFTRFNQNDLRNVKASNQTAKLLKGEVIRLAKTFEDQNMFQAVNKLAPQFKVERSLSDRHRFDVLTPVNVIPGLHVIATNISAGTQFDTLTV